MATIKVVLTGRQVVTYKRVVELTPEQHADLTALLDREDEDEIGGVFEDWIVDYEYDSETMEDCEMVPYREPKPRSTRSGR